MYPNIIARPIKSDAINKEFRVLHLFKSCFTRQQGPKKHTIWIILWAFQALIFMRWIRLLYLTSTTEPATHLYSLLQIEIVSRTFIQSYKVTWRRCMCLHTLHMKFRTIAGQLNKLIISQHSK